MGSEWWNSLIIFRENYISYYERERIYAALFLFPSDKKNKKRKGERKNDGKIFKQEGNCKGD